MRSFRPQARATSPLVPKPPFKPRPWRGRYPARIAPQHRSGHNMRPDRRFKPPPARYPIKSRQLAYFRNDRKRLSSKGKDRRLGKTRQNGCIGLENRPSAEFVAAAAVEHGLAARTLSEHADKPAPIPELGQISLRWYFGGSFQQDRVIRRALRPSRRQRAAHNRHIRFPRQGRPRRL